MIFPNNEPDKGSAQPRFSLLGSRWHSAWHTPSRSTHHSPQRSPHHSPLRSPLCKLYTALVITGAVLIYGNIAYASGGGDPLAVVSNLSTFIFSIIRAMGMIMLGFGIVQFGLSLKGHDPSQRANSFLTIAGGIVIVFAKEILDLITGGA